MTNRVLTSHLGFLFRLPVAGEKLKALVEDGKFILHSNPWMKRATFLGLVAFVMFPLAAIGSVEGSIFGRHAGHESIRDSYGDCDRELAGMCADVFRQRAYYATSGS